MGRDFAYQVFNRLAVTRPVVPAAIEVFRSVVFDVFPFAEFAGPSADFGLPRGMRGFFFGVNVNSDLLIAGDQSRAVLRFLTGTIAYAAKSRHKSVHRLCPVDAVGPENSLHALFHGLPRKVFLTRGMSNAVISPIRVARHLVGAFAEIGETSPLAQRSDGALNKKGVRNLFSSISIQIGS